ncbi:MAG TPA: hypothetical protein VNL15_06100 [Dehalococcoidia bacterium]|nr:hypothetical protein [Dehalococcoidia bacterium]
MATSIVPFNKLQVGIESVKGTLVAATRVINGEHRFSEEQDFYRSANAIGVRANVGGAGVITRKGCMLEVASELTAEEILWPLLTGIRGAVTPTGAGADKTWTFTPQLTTAVLTIDSATLEFVRADGVTNHYYGEAGYGMTSSFKIDWAFNEVAKLAWSMFARARQTGTPTAALSPYASREELVSPLLAVYQDTTWAGLGTTQLTGIIRSASFECTTGLAPDYTLDARADKDMVQHKVSSLKATLSLVMEFDATAASRFANYRANDIVFIRLKNTGSVVGAANKTVQIDGAYRFTATPEFSADGEQVLMTASLESVYDSTSTKTLEFVVINALAAVA